MIKYKLHIKSQTFTFNNSESLKLKIKDVVDAGIVFLETYDIDDNIKQEKKNDEEKS